MPIFDGTYLKTVDPAYIKNARGQALLNMGATMLGGIDPNTPGGYNYSALGKGTLAGTEVFNALILQYQEDQRYKQRLEQQEFDNKLAKKRIRQTNRNLNLQETRISNTEDYREATLGASTRSENRSIETARRAEESSVRAAAGELRAAAGELRAKDTTRRNIESHNLSMDTARENQSAIEAGHGSAAQAVQHAAASDWLATVIEILPADLQEILTTANVNHQHAFVVQTLQNHFKSQADLDAIQDLNTAGSYGRDSAAYIDIVKSGIETDLVEDGWKRANGWKEDESGILIQGKGKNLDTYNPRIDIEKFRAENVLSLGNQGFLREGWMDELLEANTTARQAFNDRFKDRYGTTEQPIRVAAEKLVDYFRDIIPLVPLDPNNPDPNALDPEVVRDNAAQTMMDQILSSVMTSLFDLGPEADIYKEIYDNYERVFTDPPPDGLGFDKSIYPNLIRELIQFSQHSMTGNS